MSALKFKRGEYIFKEGDKSESIFAIQSGKVALQVVRPNNLIEIVVLNGQNILGEQALFGQVKHVLSAQALTEVTALEMPAAPLKTQVEAAPGFLKVLIKSLADQMKSAFVDLKKIKMEKENSPCPQILIPKVFSAINLTTRHLGKKLENGDWEIAWNSLKLYTIRMFLESPQRMESAIQLLTKLKYISMHYEKNEEGQEELSKLTIHNLQGIEDFSEFYQYNIYKGSPSEIIVFDEIAMNVADVLVKATEGVELDRKGASQLSFDKATEMIKETLGVAFKNTHIELLEKKGLFMKRSPNDKEVILSFDRKEFANTVAFWRIINEINKWNETGRVNMQEEEKKKPKPGENLCPDCAGVVQQEAKFCANCGFKLKAA